MHNFNGSFRKKCSLMISRFIQVKKDNHTCLGEIDWKQIDSYLNCIMCGLLYNAL